MIIGEFLKDYFSIILFLFIAIGLSTAFIFLNIFFSHFFEVIELDVIVLKDIKHNVFG